MSEQIEVKKTVCMWCNSHCKLAVRIKGGRLESLEEDKEHPVPTLVDVHARTVKACPWARAAVEEYYHPDRLSYPLKRAGERGQGKWEKISWDQALDEIANKLKEIRGKYGPEALAGSSGTGRTHDEYRRRFFNLFGSPNIVGQGAICFGPSMVTSAAVVGWPSVWSRIRRGITKSVMLVGANPEQAAQRFWSVLLDAKKGGTKLIVIDPRRTIPADWADLWLQLRPGTDAAMFMALIGVVIKEGLYDKEFVQQWCYGFDKLAERAQDYTPERVAEITWVPAEKIREAARMYAENRPGVIQTGMGVEHLSNCIDALHARFALSAIVGNVDVAGGEIIRGQHPTIIGEYYIELGDKISPEQKAKALGSDRFKFLSWPGYDMVQEATGKRWGHFGTGHTCFAHAPTVYRAMITGKPYPVRAMITLSSNPMVTQANTKLIYQALKSLDLYVVVDFWKTPSAEIADYVLPAANWLERPNIFTWWDSLESVEAGETAMPPRVEGKWDRRTDYEFFRGLGIRLGQEEFWPWKTLEEAYSYRLAPAGYTFEEFMIKMGGADYRPIKEKKYLERGGFGTPTGKAELYSTILEKLGYDPLPKYQEPAESPVSTPELAKEYPLMLITGGRHIPFFHSEHRQIESLRKMHPDPLVQLNPRTASELGIRDGDWVWIETPRGRIKQKCQYFGGIHPKVIHAQHGWWFPEDPGEEPWLHGVWQSNVNVLTEDEPDHCSPKSGGWPLRALLCRVYPVKTY